MTTTCCVDDRDDGDDDDDDVSDGFDESSVQLHHPPFLAFLANHFVDVGIADVELFRVRGTRLEILITAHRLKQMCVDRRAVRVGALVLASFGDDLCVTDVEIFSVRVS